MVDLWRKNIGPDGIEYDTISDYLVVLLVNKWILKHDFFHKLSIVGWHKEPTNIALLYIFSSLFYDKKDIAALVNANSILKEFYLLNKCILQITIKNELDIRHIVHVDYHGDRCALEIKVPLIANKIASSFITSFDACIACPQQLFDYHEVDMPRIEQRLKEQLARVSSSSWAEIEKWIYEDISSSTIKCFGV